MNTLGICTWTLGIKDIDALMAKIAELGLNGVQYCEDQELASASEVKAAAARQGLELIIYDPFDCRPGEKNGPASKNNAIAFYKDAIDFAAALGCGQTLQGLAAWAEDCDDAEAWQFLVECVQALTPYAAKRGVALSFEPCNLYELPLIHTATDFQKLIDMSGCRDIQILLDSFHMNIGEHAPLETLKAYAGKNSVFHISGSNREGIEESNFDFQAYHSALQQGGFDGPCVLELVLSDNPANTPPRDAEEMARLSDMIIRSRERWQGYAAKAA